MLLFGSGLYIVDMATYVYGYGVGGRLAMPRGFSVTFMLSGYSTMLCRTSARRHAVEQSAVKDSKSQKVPVALSSFSAIL